jgi:hypothetical protein
MDGDWWQVDPLDAVIAGGFDDLGPGHRLGGASPKRVLRSRINGRLYIYKSESQSGIPEEYRPHADRLAASVAAVLLDRGEYVPVGLTVLDYGKGPVLGSVQPLLEGAVQQDFRACGQGELWCDPDFLSDADLARIQREQVLDWLVANHDAHGNQWIRVRGVLLGIDKTQACKHLGQDRLDPDYHPNAGYGEDNPVYHYLFHAVRNGWRSVDPGVIEPVLARADGLSDEAFLGHFAGYLDVCRRRPGLRRRAEEYPRLLLERRRNLRADFGAYYGRMLGRPMRL